VSGGREEEATEESGSCKGHAKPAKKLTGELTSKREGVEGFQDQ